MDFFGRQARARAQTTRLVVLFGLAVVGITVAVMAAVAVVVGPLPPLVIGAGLVTLGVIAIATLVRSSQLASGGGVVARSLGATPVTADTRDPALRRLRNVVEEIAIASGVPVPEVYVLDQELAINAFAAGWSPADAAVAVTRGALEQLTRDELQGVIAHEFSHILNGDMRLNIRLMGVLFGITVLALLGRTVLRGGRFRSRSKGAGGVMLVAVAVTVVGYVGLFFGRLIKAGVSRQREFLADAAAVQFTRQTRGLAGALKRIAAHPQGARLAETEAEEVSHMLFGDGLGLSGLWATHPPLPARLEALEGHYDPGEIARLRAAPPAGVAETAAAAPSTGPLPVLGALAPAAVSALVGSPPPSAYPAAAVLRTALPPDLEVAAQDPNQAADLVCALALAHESSARALQIALLTQRVGSVRATAVAVLGEEVAQLAPELRLPLAALCLPALRQRPPARNQALREVLGVLMRADGQLDLSEYCLARLVHTLVGDTLHPARARVHGRRRLVHCRTEVAGLLAVLASQGHLDTRAAQHAWVAGFHHAYPQVTAVRPEVSDWLPVLERTLPVLDGLDPPGKQLLVEAMAVTLQHDGRVTVPEAELLRTVCAVLHCPLPPLAATPG